MIKVKEAKELTEKKEDPKRRKERGKRSDYISTAINLERNLKKIYNMERYN